MKKAKPYSRQVLDLMAEKTEILTKAHAMVALGMPDVAEIAWATAAAHEERLAPLLEALDRDREAAMHRVSAASCYQKAGDSSRAINLFRAALSGPLLDGTRRDVEEMLAASLKTLSSMEPRRGELAVGSK